MNARTKKYLWLAVRILVSVLCVAWVLKRVDFKDRVDVTEGGTVRSVRGWIMHKEVDQKTGNLAWVKVRRADGVEETYLREQLAADPATGGPVVAEGLEHDFSDVFSKGRWPWFFAAAAAYTIAPLFGAWRWRMLLGVQNIHLTFGEAWRLTYIGSFFNTFMLGLTGGDVVKAYYVAKRTDRKAEAITTVFLDRVVGIFGLGLLCAMALVLKWGDPALVEVRTVVLVFLAGCAAAGVVFYSRRVRRLLLVGRLLKMLPFQHVVTRLDEAVFVYRFHRRVVLLAVLQSWGAHVITIVSGYLSVLALGLHPEPHYFLIYMPAIWILAAFIPSVGALGVVEGWTQRYFTASVLGVATVSEGLALALAMALLFRAAQFLAVLPGGLLNIVHPEVSVKEAEHEIDEGVL